MNAPCLRDLATHMGVPPADLADELRLRFELVLEAASRVHRVADSEARRVHADLDALAEFVAAVRLDLPIPYLPVRCPDAATASAAPSPEVSSPERQFR